jgi:hypothetical protein
VRLAALVAILAGIITSNPGLVLGMLPYFPDGWARNLITGLVIAVVFIIPTLTRLLKKEPCPPGQKSA